jgi:hypothetical protein
MRYLSPILPPLIILLVFGVHNIYLRIARPGVLVAAVLTLTTLNFVYLGSYFKRVSPLAYLSGHESREAYLTRSLAEYPVFQHINKNLPSSARIYLLFVGRRTYYCRRDYFYDGGDLPWFLLQTINGAEDPRAMGVRLKEKGLTHLMVRQDLLHRFLMDNLAPDRHQLWRAFARHSLKEIFYARGYSLYQIDG